MAEVAGVVLGAVPIVLEALKQYHSLCKLCKRFKQCRNDVDRLLKRLQVQQVIFQNETELLLRGALGADKAEAMIQDLTHPHWQNQAIEIRVNRFLGKSKLALTTAGQEVTEIMNSFAKRLESLRPADVQSDRRNWKGEIKKRFKFAFSEEDLIEVADTIATLTAEYRTLRSQLREKAFHEPEPETDLRGRQLSLQSIVATRTAAQRVYEVLAVACRLHAKHHAHFSLRPRIAPHETGTEIKFHIAYRHLTRNQVQDHHDVLWFEIESVLGGTVPSIPPSLSLPRDYATSTPRVSTTLSIRGTIQSQKKGVRFEPDTRITPAGFATQESASSPDQTDSTVRPLPDLVKQRDFCRQVRACYLNPPQTGECIGLLESSTQWQHRLYPSASPTVNPLSNDAETLSSLLASVKQDTGWSNGISPIQRLQLAKLLSTAILNFFATPWMQSSWKSDDIFLYGMDYHGLNLLQHEPEAFIEVPIDEHVTSVNQTTPDILAPFVRNSTLFSLGVMLIELAFEKPLQHMVSQSDRNHTYATPEYHASMRLSKEVSARMSARYGKIVEQCLLCAFGHGTELENPSLQSAIHKDVVLELDRLSTDFQQLVLI